MTIGSSGSAGGTPPIVDNGIVSGLNTQAIIQALMTSYQQPVTDLQTQQAGLNSHAADYQAINKDLLAFQTAAQALNTPSGWGARQATSSDSAAVTATAASGTPSGSVSFNVLSLAAANSVVSSGSVASTSDVVDANPSFLLSQGGAQIGFSSLAAGSGLTLGSHTVDVTQASAAAATTGSIALASQTGISIGPSNNTVNVTVNGTSFALTVAASPPGGYSGSSLLGAIQSAIGAAGASGVLQAGYDANGNLVLATVDQGSTQSLQVTGGSALAGLGLSAMAGATTGVDGVVSVDGTSTTLSTITPGSTISLPNGSGGTVSATLNGSSALASVNASLLSTGSVTGTNVSTGNGSLADVVANINAAGTGIIASAVQTGTNQFILQLSSSTTGTAADLSVDAGAFSSSALGSMRTAAAGADAQIQVGGAGGYTLNSQTDTFSGLLPGLSITVAAQTTNPVTVTVTPDAKATAASVQTLVTAANTVLSDIQMYAGYNQSTKTGGPLMGSAVLQNLQNQILGVFASTSGTSSLGNGANVGVKLDNGQITFDQSTFESAFSANPSGVAALFTQGGSFTPGSPTYAGAVNFAYASPTTRAGSYDVTVTHSATQATDAGTVLSGGTVSAGETLTISSGGQNVNYATTAGQSLAAISAGINAALAGAGISLSAQVTNSGQQLELTSSDFGSLAAFTVTSTNTGAGTTGLAGATANNPVSFAGTDVAGTINGVAATGTGQFLAAPVADPTLGGLTVQVTEGGITSSTDLGSFTYKPGIAQSLASLATAMADPTTGAITTSAKGLTNQANALNSQIGFAQRLANAELKSLQQEFSKLEVTLGMLKNQGSALASALSGLPAH
jgi:flagellar hook-associated protein 2